VTRLTRHRVVLKLAKSDRNMKLQTGIGCTVLRQNLKNKSTRDPQRYIDGIPGFPRFFFCRAYAPKEAVSAPDDNDDDARFIADM